MLLINLPKYPKKMMLRLIVKCGLFMTVLILIGSCKPPVDKSEFYKAAQDSEYFYEALKQLTDVIVHDIFSPPVASRVYSYPCIAAHETIIQRDNTSASLAHQLNGLTAITSTLDTTDVIFEIASIVAFYDVSKALIFSEDRILDAKARYLNELDSIGVPKRVANASEAYGSMVADHILEWADKDNYKETRSYPKYSLDDDPSRWQPTPPAYMEGIEPHWNAIRTMVLDSASQYKIAPPPKFDLAKGTEFRARTDEVYNTVLNITDEEREIASFWDCNPFVMNQTGHMMFATKKITPGGHWMGISNIASETAKLDLGSSIKVSTYVSLALFDAFISCWDEKYRSSLVRPETIINEHIDESWTPVLQTPPFPEHTSGHSVISTSAATVLTAMFGDSFKYRDDVELKYGLPVRNFDSFKEAAEEAAISRLYGGIHYMPAITEGQIQGEKVGSHLVRDLDIKLISK